MCWLGYTAYHHVCLCDVCMYVCMPEAMRAWRLNIGLGITGAVIVTERGLSDVAVAGGPRGVRRAGAGLRRCHGSCDIPNVDKITHDRS
jgi:hypothetical protein